MRPPLYVSGAAGSHSERAGEALLLRLPVSEPAAPFKECARGAIDLRRGAS